MAQLVSCAYTEAFEKAASNEEERKGMCREQRFSLYMAVLVGLLGSGTIAFAGETEHPPAPRSNGCVLNVDFEGYEDGLVGVLNSGVRWLGDPFTNIKQNKTEIANDPARAYTGRRCAYVFTDEPEQRGRILLQRRFDASETVDEIVEFVFRPALEGGVDLQDFVVWSGTAYRSNRVGVTLYANGSADDGTYSLDVEAGGTDQPVRTANVLTGLKQPEWIRFVMARSKERKTVDLWAGLPDHEVWVGRYTDLEPDRPAGGGEIGDLSQEQHMGSGYWDDIRVGGVLGQNEAPAPPEATRNVGVEAPVITYPLVVGGEKQLFVDNAAVETSEGLQRTLHSPAKRPENPLLVPEERWERDGVFFVPFDVLREGPEGKLRVWYGSYRKSENKLTFTCVADSFDGLKWERPRLGLFDFEGSKENNIIWQGRAVKPNFDPRDPDLARRYKAMTRVNGFTPLFSPDGVRWAMAEAPAIEQAYDASSVHWDPVGGKWLASCKIFKDGKRARGYAESRDYVSWTDTYPMLYADRLDDPQDELYAMRIFRYESVYLGLLKVYHVATDRCDIQLAVSRNARHWQRPDRAAFLQNSPDPGSYDYGNLDEAGNPIRIGNELWLFYSGRSILHGQRAADTDGSLCAATLRLDGFVSLGAGEEEGMLLTKPVLLGGKTLFINADAQYGNDTNQGEVRVEIVDAGSAGHAASMQCVEGFAKADCVPIRGNSVQHPVAWKGGADLGSLAGKPVRLRIFLRNAHLFAWWCQ